MLRLTRLCVEVLGAVWSDKCSSCTRDAGGEKNYNALQLLTHAGWMETVGWLARERGAPLQGMLLPECAYYAEPALRREHMEALQKMQEEQMRSWERTGGAL